ncbi:hypothetical protein ABPG72_017149 [Tetrahymena utriculariae]
MNKGPGSNYQRFQAQTQNQQIQSNQNNRQEVQQIYYGQSSVIQPQGIPQRQKNFQQNEKTSFQQQNQMQYNQQQQQQQQQDNNYFNQNNYNQKISNQRQQLPSNLHQNQQPQDTNYAQQSLQQQNQLPQNMNNSFPSTEQNRNRNILPNINYQNSNQTQSRSDSIKPFDKPKRDHSIKDKNLQQQTNQNKNSAQSQYQHYNNFNDFSLKGQLFQKLNEKIYTNKAYFQSSLRNSQQNEYNGNSNQQGIKNNQNVAPLVNQNTIQQSNLSLHTNYPIPQYPSNIIQINNCTNSNTISQQIDVSQNVQSFPYNQSQQQQNYMQQYQQSNLKYQNNQLNNLYQASQMQEQQQQQFQYRNLPIQAELIKRKEKAQISDLNQYQQNQQAQNQNLSIIQEQQISEISQSQNNQNLNQDQFIQQQPLQETENSLNIEKSTSNQLTQVSTLNINQNSIKQQSNHQNQQIESTSIQNNVKQIQNNFDQNYFETAQQKITNNQTDFNLLKQNSEKIQQVFNKGQIQDKQQTSKDNRSLKYLTYENQDLLSNSQVKSIEDDNIQVQKQQEERQLSFDSNALIIEEHTISKNDKNKETQKQEQSKETFQFLTKQQIISDKSIIEKLSEKVISQEAQQNIQQLYEEVNSKDLGQIYNFDVLKNAINISVQEFKSQINNDFNKISNLKLFDYEKILNFYQLPQEIYEQCQEELQSIHSGILTELFGQNGEKQFFETQINKEICKNMLLQYFHYAQMGEIVYCVYFNSTAIQELTQEKLQKLKDNQQLLKQGKQFEKDNLSQIFNKCLDQIKVEIEELLKQIFDSNYEESLVGLKSAFRNKKNQLIHLINEYWKQINVKNAYEIDLLSVVIIYKKIQIIKDYLNQLLVQSQDSFNSVVNQILFNQNNAKINVCPIETQISENFLIYVKNDTIQIIQKLKKKESQLFELAYCKYEQTVVANCYNNQRANYIFNNLIQIENYVNVFEKTNQDSLQKLFQNQHFKSLFQSILSESKDWSLINNINEPQLTIFLLRNILQRVCIGTDKVQERISSVNKEMQEKKKNYIEEYFNSNLNIPFFTVKFVPNMPINFEDNTVYALEEIKKIIDEFNDERKKLPNYFFQIEQSHKCGLIAMYIHEKFNTISTYIDKKNKKRSVKEFFTSFKKQSKFIPFVQQMSFSSYQKTLQYTFQLTQDLIESLTKGNINQFDSNQRVQRLQQSEFKQFNYQIQNLQQKEKENIQFDEAVLKYLIDNTKQLTNQRDQLISPSLSIQLVQCNNIDDTKYQQQNNQFKNQIKYNNQSQLKEIENNEPKNIYLQKEMIDNNQINKKQADYQDMQINRIALGHSTDIQNQQNFENQKKIDSVEEEEKKYCLENFLGF